MKGGDGGPKGDPGSTGQQGPAGRQGLVDYTSIILSIIEVVEDYMLYS